MTMKTRNTCIAAALLAVMACSAAHAQVLGGNVGGALNGTLGGGLHDTSVLTNGNANGSFGGELDTGSVTSRTMGRARGAADQTTRRARNAGANVRNRAESTVSSARDTSTNVAMQRLRRWIQRTLPRAPKVRRTSIWRSTTSRAT
jgi:hypothetical protein